MKKLLLQILQILPTSSLLPLLASSRHFTLISSLFPRIAIPNIFSTRDWFCGQHFFPWMEERRIINLDPTHAQFCSPATHLQLGACFLMGHGLVPVWEPGIGDPCPRILIDPRCAQRNMCLPLTKAKLTWGVEKSWKCGEKQFRTVS